jgi:peptidoglycan/LPS O-acetylase OafA/YrhL
LSYSRGVIGSGGGGGRDRGIDLLRAVAILTVMSLHWVNSGLMRHPGTVLDAIFIRVAGHGTYGVTLFFILSGFLITRTTMRRERDFFALSIRDFYVRRIARIQPLFIAIVAFGLVMVAWGPAASTLFQYTFREPKAAFGGEFILSLFTFTYNWEMILRRDAFMFRGLHWDVMWSLAVEEQFYLAFPLLVWWAAGKRRLGQSLAAIIALGIAVRILCDAFHAGLEVKLFNSFACFDTLALGVACALYFDDVPRERGICRMALLLGAAAIGFANYHGGVVWLVLGACLFLYGAPGAALFRHRFWAPLARFGELSYGLYLLHATALLVVSPWLRGMDVLTGFAVFAAASLLLAELVYRAWEAPMNAWLRARFVL